MHFHSRLNFSDFQAAQDEAEAKASQLSRRDVDAMQLNGENRLAYGRPKDAVKEFNLPLGCRLIEYSEARKLLDGVSLVDAARFYARHHRSGFMKTYPSSEKSQPETIQPSAQQLRGVARPRTHVRRKG